MWRKCKTIKRTDFEKTTLMGTKMASYLYRTAQPFTLATFRSWGSSTGAGRIRLAAANINKNAQPLPG